MELKEDSLVPQNSAAVKERLKTIPNVVRADLNAVCCDSAGKMILFVSIEEQGAPQFSYRPAPKGSTKLPDEGVRNNATRSIGTIAALANRKPELGIKIDPVVFVKMLHSLTWFDRNKALMVLKYLTHDRSPKILEPLRKNAPPNSVEMERWKAGHGVMAFQMIGRIAGLSEKEIKAAQSREAQEKVINQALKGFSTPKMKRR